MNVIGYGTFVRLAPVVNLLSRESFLTGEFFGAREKELWARCLTRKRKVEYIGGRLAAKIVANIYRLNRGRSACRWREIDIFPQADNRPVCRHYDGLEHAISISHSNGWAAALVVPESDRVAIDIENTDSRKLPIPAMFGEAEINQLESPQDAWRRWTIKEAYCKLTGKGILGWEKELITYKMQTRLWLAIPFQMSFAEKRFLASGSCSSIMISIGFNQR
ncbi:MAG TPA: 4'-phosphopantetheinyl transferase superfamily protein [Pyrinomonadaceae bacterium]|jgi:phosphopantetheinyl transferase (holo-ACP synthase)